MRALDFGERDPCIPQSRIEKDGSAKVGRGPRILSILLLSRSEAVVYPCARPPRRQGGFKRADRRGIIAFRRTRRCLPGGCPPSPKAPSKEVRREKTYARNSRSKFLS